LDKQGLRVRLRIDNDAHKLSMIPWEYCWGDGIPMALDKKTPFIRYVHSSKAPTRITRADVVKILVVLASPEDDELDPVSVEDEASWIEEALDDLVQEERIQLEIVRDINRRELFRTVSRFDPHIFHFLGHGAIGQDGKGELYLTAEDGRAEPLDEQQLKALFQSSDTGLAILSACQSGVTLEEIDARDGDLDAGTSRQNSGAMGLAPTLVGAGIPAVIAMQSKVPQDTAITFVRDLYENLIDDRPLDVAMTQARIGAYLDDKRFWAIPTLFMRSPDGLIWQPGE
jgi:CHAT domain-containing protein